jgi:hypothetical protein
MIINPEMLEPIAQCYRAVQRKIARPLPAFSIAPNTCYCPIKGKLLAMVQTEPCHP